VGRCDKTSSSHPIDETLFQLPKRGEDDGSLRSSQIFVSEIVKNPLPIGEFPAGHLVAGHGVGVCSERKTMSEELGRKFEELREFVSKLVESSGETMSSDLNDLLLALVSKLEEEESPQGQSQEQGQHL
jgi:hypothetical protein